MSVGNSCSTMVKCRISEKCFSQFCRTSLTPQPHHIFISKSNHKLHCRYNSYYSDPNTTSRSIITMVTTSAFIITIFFNLLVVLVVVPRRSESSAVDIDLVRKGHGDQYLPQVSKKAHPFEELLEFLGLVDTDESNFTDIVNVLSAIPHNITVDISASTTGNLQWVQTYLPSTGCLDYAPTYLFAFNRQDIIDNFGSEYFILEPNEINNQDHIPLLHANHNPAGVKKVASTAPSALGTPPPPPNKLKQWLHTPKCGSSFAVTATKLGFKEVTHDPCPLDADCELVSLFREPSQRLISRFYYSMPVFERCELSKLINATESDYRESVKKCFNNFLKERAVVGRFKNSATTTIFFGCQAKMVIGYNCEEPTIPLSYYKNPNFLAEEAVSMMRNTEVFKFIGITNFFEASVTLAHQMLGYDLEIVDEFRKINTRAQNEGMRAISGGMSGNAQLDQIQYYSDFLCENNLLCNNLPDEAVFSEAKKIMLMNVLKHHSTPVRISALSNTMPNYSQELKYKKINDKSCKASSSHVNRIRHRKRFVL
jgi:hypothetical protein